MAHDKQILVVDDDPGIRKLTRIVLERNGFTVLTAEGGVAVFDIIAGETIDLILLDIMMPQLDGWATLKQLKAKPETADIPVIIVTAKAETVDQFLGIEVYGVADYITKPFLPGELMERVATILDKK
jgi:two-component system alkaline phosphatase synthesis response regulator PhoP